MTGAGSGAGRRTDSHRHHLRCRHCGWATEVTSETIEGWLGDSAADRAAPHAGTRCGVCGRGRSAAAAMRHEPSAHRSRHPVDDRDR